MKLSMIVLITSSTPNRRRNSAAIHAHAAPASAPASSMTGKASTAGAPRKAPDAAPSCPVWLLHPPEPLIERHARPVLDGQALQLLSGPERIEAGWWDAALAERDYFIAQTPEGALVWI